MKNFTKLIILLLLIGGGLNAQPYNFPTGCLPPETDPNSSAFPRIFGEAQLNGTPLASGSTIVVLNASDGTVIGRTSVFQQSIPGNPPFQAFLAVLNINAQGMGCPVFTNLTDVIVIYEVSGGSYLRASNSEFTGVTNLGNILTGPDGLISEVDVFNFTTPFLPVTFASFSARKASDREVLVQWATASESGNAYFVVERSNDGERFGPIGRLDGAGNSQELIAYSLMDNAPLAGTNFYRIKQVDFDGSFSYSNIVPVEMGKPAAGKVSVYPNPANGFFEIAISNGWATDQVTVSIFDVQGKQVRSWDQTTDANKRILTNDLTAGVYTLQVKAGQAISTQRLIIE